MKFKLDQSIEILERTPAALSSMLLNISSEWTSNNEGGETWCAYDVVGHLIHGEKTDWIPRMEIILSNKADKKFEPFDRFFQFEEEQQKSLAQRLEEFKRLREDNILLLRSKKISNNDLSKTGIHPVFGEVTLSQLLSTWVAHDLNHIAQVARVMAKQYNEEVGPWTAYLRILQQ